jgi:dTDP-4-amino-4,6-dideoxygalactose transaminase
VSGFETEFARYQGAKFAIGVASGTDAIKIALRALGIGQGDEVITVSNTAVPTVSGIRETGAIPVFADIDQYLTVDVSDIENKITPKTKAIVAVHLYGGACDMKRILKIARKHGLKVVEDCAQSDGGMIKNKRLGTFGDAGAFSFYPTKNLGTLGDGGIIITNKKTTSDHCRFLRMYGMEKGYYSKHEGWNSRLDEIQAAFLSVKLPFLDEWNKRRNNIAKSYISKIRNPLIDLPKIRPGNTHAFHLFVIKTKYREKLVEFLKENRIGHAIHYLTPIHLQDGYSFLKYKKGTLPKTEEAAKQILSLPIFPELKQNEVDRVIEVINGFKIK